MAGGSAPAQDSQQSGGTPGQDALPDPATMEQVPPPVTTPEVPSGSQPTTDTEPDEELIVPLEDEDATTTPSNSGGTAAEDEGLRRRFYNYHRPHGAHNGKTPYEVLKERMQVSKEDSADRASSIEAAPAVKTVARRFPPSGCRVRGK